MSAKDYQKDYYKTLGVPKTATAAEIKKAYRELARKYHPDANKGSTDAEERFKEITEAYNVVSDEKQRKEYDEARSMFGGFRVPAGSRPGAGAGAGNFDFGDLFGGEGLGDVIGGIFRGLRTIPVVLDLARAMHEVCPDAYLLSYSNPMAMLPFLGYHVADYFQHWLDLGKNSDESKLPKVFFVNWFRRGEGGKFLWPGFGENSRVLKWIVERLSGDAAAVETPVGNLPAPGALDLDGLRLSQADLDLLLTVDPQDWKLEADRMPEFFAMFGEHLPERLWELHQDLIDRLSSS